MEAIRICIGTDRWQRDSGAEAVLEHSIRKHATRPVEITWMRSGDPGWEISANGEGDTWAAGGAVAGGWVKGGGMTWGTPFSCFRFAVPELMGFQGKAIYLDADMLLLDDIAKLIDMPIANDRGLRAVDIRRTDVSVIDCAWFEHKPWWPSIAKMKTIRARVFEYMQLLLAHNAIDPTLPPEWNDVDGRIYSRAPETVKLLHYSNVLVGQPWCPYDNVRYIPEWPHVSTCRSAAERWFQEQQEMAEAR